jgi:acyl-CoA synthetase
MASGSTGMAKAVPYTHRKILHMGFTWAKLMELESGARFFSYFPFGWQARYPVTVLTSKVTQVTLTDLRALTSIEQINKLTLIALENDKCVSAVLLAPAICNLIKNENTRCKAFPLKVICTAGLPIDSICSTIIGPKANKFAAAYGCTEMGFVSVISVDSAFDYESYAVWNPVYGAEVKIVDGNGYIVPVGTSGELYIRIRDRFLGYINAKEKTERCYDKTGWYKSDDVGFMKLNGCLVVTGRKSDMMIISDELVSLSYLEDILKKHDCISNAYIYHIHYKQTFHQACAAILLRKNKVTTADELDQFIRKQGGNYMYQQHIYSLLHFHLHIVVN